MMQVMYILVNKIPIQTTDVSLWSSNRSVNRSVCYTEYTNDVSVSTVFLGLDHNHSNVGEPILFETMIFGGEYNDYQIRYCTYDEAVKGHDEACLMVNKIQIDRDNKLKDILK